MGNHYTLHIVYQGDTQELILAWDYDF